MQCQSPLLFLEDLCLAVRMEFSFQCSFIGPFVLTYSPKNFGEHFQSVFYLPPETVFVFFGKVNAVPPILYQRAFGVVVAGE